MPVGVTAVEQSQSHGRQEQRVRALRETLHIMVGDVKQDGAENIFDHTVPQWAVRHAEWIQNFLVKSDVSLRGGGTINITIP